MPEWARVLAIVEIIYILCGLVILAIAECSFKSPPKNLLDRILHSEWGRATILVVAWPVVLWKALKESTRDDDAEM